VAGCPPVHLADVANDWTHSNSIAYSPSDGNLIVSFPSSGLDHLVVDYRDGQGGPVPFSGASVATATSAWRRKPTMAGRAISMTPTISTAM
jgi:hypothetical protein